MTPTHFFLIDVSFIAVTSGATAAACASVARVLDELPGMHPTAPPTRTRVPWSALYLFRFHDVAVERSRHFVGEGRIRRSHANTVALAVVALMLRLRSIRESVIHGNPCVIVSSYWSDCSAGGDRALAGVATFDSTIHFYSLRPSQSQPQMLVVPDVSDPYAPQSASLICSVKESRALVGPAP